MNISGMKRGLAATAISALAVAGLPLLASSASANSYAEQLAATPNDAVLYSLSSGQASVTNDGVNNTVHLLAGAGSNVSQVRFEYSSTGVAPFTAIGTVSRANGLFSAEWTPPTAIYNLATTVVRAVPISSVGVDLAGVDAATVTVTSTANANDISNAPASNVGIFRQPYAADAGTAGNNNAGPHNYDLGIINGTTSDVSAAPSLTAYNLTTGAPTGTTGVNGTIFETPANGVRAYTTSVDFTGYNYAGTVDQAVVGVTTGSDDAEGVNVYEQTIGSVTAVASPASVPTGTNSSALVTVLDTTGKPVRGAQVVFDRDGDGNLTAAENGEHYYTNVKGVATIPNLAGSAAGSTYTFHVNTTDTDAYEPAIDFQRSVTVSTFTPVATTVTATSADGNAFDFDEYAAGDLKVKVNDQNGAGLGGQTVNYTLSVAEFAPITAGNPQQAPITGTVTTAADGTANIPLPAGLDSGTYTLSTYINRDGTPGQGTGDLSGTDLVFKAGQGTLAFADANPVSAAQGTTRTFDASLKLQDGTVLAGRAVTFTYNAPAGGNSVVAAQGNQPTGTTRVSDTQATDTTDAAGVVSVAVSDPASPSTAELGANLDAVSATNAIGNAGANAADLTVNWAITAFPAGSTNPAVVINATGDAAGATTNKPGRVTNGSVTVTADPDGTGPLPVAPVAGVQVTLSVDKGFFTDGTPVTPVVGADTNTFRNLGTSITVTTNNAGVANFQTTIERSAGFDDDGLDVQTVTAVAGSGTSSASDTEDYGYSSAAPVNGGEVIITKVPAAQQNNPTGPTRVGDTVGYDVRTTDQFGNPFAGATLTSSATGGTLVTSTTVSDVDAAADFVLTSNTAGTATFTVNWTNAPFSRYAADNTNTPADADTNPDVVTGTETLSDTESETFYAVSFNDSVFTLTTSPEGDVPVGSTVSETVKVVDQNGRPVQGLNVTFDRSGPGGDNAQVQRFTNADGIAVYTFTGNVAGVATISATVDNGSLSKTLTDTVNFVDDDAQVPTTFTLDSSPEGNVPAGTAVVETVTVLDQNGDPVEGVSVEFNRNDTGASQVRTTNAAGQATYTVSRATAGIVDVTAVVNFGTGNRTLTDQIVYERKAITVTLAGNSLRSFDVLTVRTTPDAEGAAVVVYKRAGGKIGRVGTGQINSEGQLQVTVKDINGRRATTYFATVATTSNTLAGRTANKTVL